MITHHNYDPTCVCNVFQAYIVKKNCKVTKTSFLVNLYSNGKRGRLHDFLLLTLHEKFYESQFPIKSLFTLSYV